MLTMRPNCGHAWRLLKHVCNMRTETRFRVFAREVKEAVARDAKPEPDEVEGMDGDSVFPWQLWLALASGTLIIMIAALI